jgi:hypothetical protein
MGVVLLLFNISRPRRLFELSNVTHMASRTLAENSPLEQTFLALGAIAATGLPGSGARKLRT